MLVVLDVGADRPASPRALPGPNSDRSGRSGGSDRMRKSRKELEGGRRSEVEEENVC